MKRKPGQIVGLWSSAIWWSGHGVVFVVCEKDIYIRYTRIYTRIHIRYTIHKKENVLFTKFNISWSSVTEYRVQFQLKCKVWCVICICQKKVQHVYELSALLHGKGTSQLKYIGQCVFAFVIKTSAFLWTFCCYSVQGTFSAEIHSAICTCVCYKKTCFMNFLLLQSTLYIFSCNSQYNVYLHLS